MIRFQHILTAVLAVALCGVALESELPQRLAARFGLWPELMRPGRDVDIVARDLQRTYPTQHADVVMLGDSLTAEVEWAEMLPGRNVVNRGVAGQTVYEIAERVDDVLRLRPQAVFLMAGTNDLMEGREPAEVATDYAALVDRLTAGGPTVVVQAVLHVGRDRNRLGLQRFWYNRRNDKIAEVNDRLREIAAKRGLPFLDLNLILAPGGVLPDAASIDGTHLQADLYPLWANEVDAVLSRMDGGRATSQAEPGRS